VTSSWLDPFTPAHVRTLDVYQPGKPVEELERELGITGALKVASNENPLGPSPAAVAAIGDAIGNIHRYPDAGGWALRRALADRYDVDISGLAIGNGSNDLLYQLVLATCEPTDEVLSPRLGFLSYRLSAQVAGRPFVEAPCTRELACDIDALIAAITPRTKLIVVGTPNNPTGTVLSCGDAAKLVAALPARALLVIDEAYCEYAAAWPELDRVDGLALLRSDRRVISLRTFSKIYGLAGMRVGFAAADPAVIEQLGRVGRTFAVGSLAQVAAAAALGDVAHVARSAALGRRVLERLRAEVRGPGVFVYPSCANFALIETGRPSGPIYDRLLRLGVIVRPMAAWGLPTCIRVSIALEQDVPRVVGALNDALAATA
jgi:histidinol-phosphate aminotransferase